jgi:flagellar protein FlaG
MKIEQAVIQNAASFDLQGQRTGQKAQETKKDGEGLNVNDLSRAQISRAEKNTLPVSEQFLINSIEKANKAVIGVNTRFEFSIHEGTKEIMVKVLNADTGDLIREIPSEKILDMVAGIWKAAGLFVDEKR